MLLKVFFTDEFKEAMFCLSVNEIRFLYFLIAVKNYVLI